MSLRIINRSIVPTLAEVDILVVGAGSAGCVAALAARKSKAHFVILLERYGFAGGSSTQMLDTFYGFFTPGDQPRKIVGGLPDQVVNRLAQKDGVFLRPNTYGAGTGVNYNPELLKYVWDQLLVEAGVRPLYHATLVDVETGSDGFLQAAIISTKSGLFKIKAKRFIDASGDADLCHAADIPYEKAGDQEPAQTLTTTFRMSNVDQDAFEEAGGKQHLMRLMGEALDNGTHPLPRKAGSAHCMVQKGCIATVAVRVADMEATNFEALTAAEIEGRRQAFVFEGFFRDCVPGYDDSHIIGLSHQIGVRETRRVYGEYRLTKSDCLQAKQFNDAHASCRSMAQTMAMGQAAGAAASLSLFEDIGARNIETTTLITLLESWGSVLQMPDSIAHTAKGDWEKTRNT
ncbi:MAG: FAD-dependent oxidoreductase [Verrucomicrobiia bacterium]